MTAPPTLHQNGVACFASILGIYEHRIGHVCRAIARHIPPLLEGLPANPVILDNACGTGAVTEQVFRAMPSARFYAADAVPGMVAAMKQAVATASPDLRAAVLDIQVMNGQELSYPDVMFDASIMNFGLFFFPDPVLGVQQVYRTLKDQGTAVFSLWSKFGFKPILWAVQDIVKPKNALLELPLMESWCDGTRLEKTINEGGFGKVKMVRMTEGLWGQSREDFEHVLLENFSAMVHDNWTAKEKEHLPHLITEVLDKREAEFYLRDEEKVGVAMEAWVAVCRK